MNEEERVRLVVLLRTWRREAGKHLVQATNLIPPSRQADVVDAAAVERRIRREEHMVTARVLRRCAADVAHLLDLTASDTDPDTAPDTPDASPTPGPSR